MRVPRGIKVVSKLDELKNEHILVQEGPQMPEREGRWLEEWAEELSDDMLTNRKLKQRWRRKFNGQEIDLNCAHPLSIQYTTHMHVNVNIFNQSLNSVSGYMYGSNTVH